MQDTEWTFEFTDHDRTIVRAIVFDDDGFFYFVRAERDDEFGRATLIETSGGGVEEGEDLIAAIKRELKEELGADVEMICKLKRPLRILELKSYHIRIVFHLNAFPGFSHHMIIPRLHLSLTESC